MVRVEKHVPAFIGAAASRLHLGRCASDQAGLGQGARSHSEPPGGEPSPATPSQHPARALSRMRCNIFDRQPEYSNAEVRCLCGGAWADVRHTRERLIVGDTVPPRRVCRCHYCVNARQCRPIFPGSPHLLRQSTSPAGGAPRSALIPFCSLPGIDSAPPLSPSFFRCRLSLHFASLVA